MSSAWLAVRALCTVDLIWARLCNKLCKTRHNPNLNALESTGQWLTRRLTLSPASKRQSTGLATVNKLGDTDRQQAGSAASTVGQQRVLVLKQRHPTVCRWAAWPGRHQCITPPQRETISPSQQTTEAAMDAMAAADLCCH